MRKLQLAALICALGLPAAAEAGIASPPVAGPVDRGFRLDLSAAGRAAYTWYEGGPALPQPGFDLAVAGEYELAAWVPARFEFSYTYSWPSSISSGGELYRGWNGLRFAALTGWRLPAFDLLGGARLGFFAGGAITAAGYDGTYIGFAYPSALAEIRLDVASSRENGFWIGLPLEYLFRGSYSTASVGLALGWRMGPLASKPTAGRQRGGSGL